MLIQGTLPGLCYAEGMTGYLYAHQIRIFGYAEWAQRLRENAERLAAENGLEIEFIRRSKSFRKEDKIHQVLKRRGEHPGLVWIFSATEPCSTYRPWHDKATGKTYLRPDDGKCLHYYFYFIDEEVGLCYVRVPTWCPFRLQVYLNGHHRLACRLNRQRIDCTCLDNAFVTLGDFERAQKIADDWPVEKLHRKLDEWADLYCPVIHHFDVGYHWSLDQIEFSTDLLFRRREDLQAIYGHLTRTAIHTVKPDNIATFLGRKLSPLYQGEMGNRFNTRIEGTLKHTRGPVSLKMYDKFGLILRIEGQAGHHQRIETQEPCSHSRLGACPGALNKTFCPIWSEPIFIGANGGETRVFWQGLSADWAAEAGLAGRATVLLGDVPAATSIWAQTERPILQFFGASIEYHLRVIP